jgi:hypothetical protein
VCESYANPVTLLRPPAFVREVMSVVDAPRKRGTLDMRWPCVQNVRLPRPAQRAQLSLVPAEAAAAVTAEERELAGTRRLIAAMDAAHVQHNQT